MTGRLTAILFFIALCFGARAQQADSIYKYVEVLPEFPGGQDSLSRFISANLWYPSEAMERNIQGRVVVMFVVDKKGKVIREKVVEGVHVSLDTEALRVARLLPDFKPGMVRGEPVNVEFILPFSFKLNQ